jgi:valyl-tRNA synthetase
MTAEDEKVFEDVWRRLGLSVDWTLTYATIGERARRASQRAFLRNLARDEAYSSDAPTIWDVTFQTAVAQAEIADREEPGAYYRYPFTTVAGDQGVYVETTRPELLPACVALVAHPDDARYRPLVGTTVRSPLFDVEVPIVAHDLAQPDKGSGIAMICTFGDTTDVTWWRELDLPIRCIVERNGRIAQEPPAAITSSGGRSAYSELAGKTVKQARTRIVELLQDMGALDGEPKPIVHPVKYYENGEHPLEIVTSRQWYIRNGGRDPVLRDELRQRALQLVWHPEFMRHRYDNWVDGLNGDWLISRQRFFGVPFPVWYPLDDEGRADYDHPLVADESSLPVDPSSDVPPGFRPDQRGQPGGFVGDPDVMDTWATSSLTPQIVCGWCDDPDLFERTFPTDLRPQGHEIIRTWLFDSVVRSHFEHGAVPWAHATINGWVLDPDRKKMSKSKGNVVTPTDLLEEHGSDAVRYWACSGRPGTDTAVDPNQFRVGRRLAIKILNASKFALGLGGDEKDTPVDAPVDVDLLVQLSALVESTTEAFEAFDYARALERTEAFFWRFCDDYLELVKGRAYGSQGAPAAQSAQAALRLALSVLVRLFAPFLPFVTEEVWSWWQAGSVHRAPWPTPAEITAAVRRDAADATGSLETAAAVLGAVRRAKSEAKRSMRAAVERVAVVTTPQRAAALRRADADLREAGAIAELVIEEQADADSDAVTVELTREDGSAA